MAEETIIYLNQRTGKQISEQVNEFSSVLNTGELILMLCEPAMPNSSRVAFEQVRGLIKYRRIKKVCFIDLAAVGSSKQIVYDFLMFCYTNSVKVISLNESNVIDCFKLDPEPFREQLIRVINGVSYLENLPRKIKYKEKAGITIGKEKPNGKERN